MFWTRVASYESELDSLLRFCHPRPVRAHASRHAIVTLATIRRSTTAACARFAAARNRPMRHQRRSYPMMIYVALAGCFWAVLACGILKIGGLMNG